MAYATEADVLKRVRKDVYDKLVEPVSGDDLLADDILDEAIGTADSMIDSYLTSRISTLPLETIPKIVTQCSVDIAVYNLHSRIQYQDIPEWVTTRYNFAVQWLKDVASGKANLETAAIEDETTDSGVTYETERQIFDSGSF